MAPSPLLPHLGMTNIFNYNKGMPVIIYYADRMASRLRLEETTPHFLAIEGDGDRVRERDGDRHTRWLTSITLIETRSLRIYLHQLQILLFLPHSFPFLIADNDEESAHFPPTTHFFFTCVWAA